MRIHTRLIQPLSQEIWEGTFRSWVSQDSRRFCPPPSSRRMELCSRVFGDMRIAAGLTGLSNSTKAVPLEVPVGQGNGRRRVTREFKLSHSLSTIMGFEPIPKTVFLSACNSTNPARVGNLLGLHSEFVRKSLRNCIRSRVETKWDSDNARSRVETKWDSDNAKSRSFENTFTQDSYKKLESRFDRHESNARLSYEDLNDMTVDVGNIERENGLQAAIPVQSIRKELTAEVRQVDIASPLSFKTTRLQRQYEKSEINQPDYSEANSLMVNRILNREKVKDDVKEEGQEFNVDSSDTGERTGPACREPEDNLTGGLPSHVENLAVASNIGTGRQGSKHDAFNKDSWSDGKFVAAEGRERASTPERGYAGDYVIGDSHRMLKRSKLMAKQIISQSSALSLGFVSQVLAIPHFWEVFALEVRPSLLSGQGGGVLITDVCQVGDVILIRDESALANELNAHALDCETLVGYDLITEDGYYLGKVRDYSLNLIHGTIISLEFDLSGIALIPSNMISTYWLSIDEVLDTMPDSLLVKRGAENRARRLTKGFWQLPTVQNKVRNQRLKTSSRSNTKYLTDFEEVEARKKRQQHTRPFPLGNASQIHQAIPLNDPEIKIRHGDQPWLPMNYSTVDKKYDLT